MSMLKKKTSVTYENVNTFIRESIGMKIFFQYAMNKK